MTATVEARNILSQRRAPLTALWMSSSFQKGIAVRASRS
jgi:hypothetical protein